MPKRAAVDALEAVTELGRRQEGFLAASQAATAGVDRQRLQRLVSRGLLERDSRGLYRILPFPESERAELWRAVLLPGVNRNESSAVLSDGTALELYDVSTINPNVTEISVPRSLRLRRDIPRSIRIHRRDYEPQDVTTLFGLPATTLFRTLVDLITENRELQFVDEAIERAGTRGLLTKKELHSISGLRELDGRVLALIKARK